ncbi:ABC transporter ATP-binding protein [Rhodococcus ruber]|uniref:ABC transporter ATP-binding protein n=1 Tax=Rhodococcus ruber TaxID=1830 RepID=A0ABT4MG00_9NOCA|nr:ABC transporter ATP-binding protein [Rhodococcus ruber]MCZ4519634.1 ABC transporter ATP-binding protein [Rhodococcus ruber]
MTASQGLVKRFGKESVPVLSGITHSFAPSSWTAIMGSSGSGKSTLLNCLSGLERPDEGMVTLDGIPLGGLDDDQLAELRRDRCGFVFQDYNLFEALDVAENVALPARLAGAHSEIDRVREVLGRVGLADRARDSIDTLSGGQRQRVAIARAMLNQPSVVFADEPTGALDVRTAHDVLALLRQVASQFGSTVLMATHDAWAAAWADEVIVLADGVVVERLPGGNVDRVLRGVNTVHENTRRKIR